MAHNVSFRYFDVRIDKENVNEDVVDLLISLKPNWTEDDLCQQEFTEGYINSMTCFYHIADENRNDALMVRVYGLEGLDVPVEREKEFLTMQVAHAAGCFPAIVAAFQNGVIYKYEPGRTMTFQDLVKPKIVKKVMHQLYHFHHIDLDSLELMDRKGGPIKYNKTPKTIESLPLMVKKIPANPKSERYKAMFEKYRKELTDEYLMREYEFVKNIHDAVKLPLALNHADLHPRNMIINDETGKLTFIDYEGSSIYYEASDLVRFFDSREMYDIYKLCEPGEPDITDEIRAMYLREYINARHEMEGKTGMQVTNEEIEILDTQIRIKQMSTILGYLVISLVFVDIAFKDLHFMDSLGYWKARYETMKNDLPALRDKYLKLIGK